MRLLYPAMILMLSGAYAHAVDFRWTLGFAQGTLEAIIRNAGESSVNIYCPSGQNDTTPGMFIDSARVKPKAKEQVTVQIIVDAE